MDSNKYIKNQAGIEKIYDVIDVDIAYNLTKTINKDLTFSVLDGEFLSILGPNGAGKSTLIKALCRILPTSKGSVLFKGKLVHRQNMFAFYFRYMSLLMKHSFSLNASHEKIQKKIDNLNAKKEQVKNIDNYVPKSWLGKLQIASTSNAQKKQDWKEYYRNNKLEHIDRLISKQLELLNITDLIQKEKKYYKENKKYKVYSSTELAKELAYVPQILDFPRNIKVYDFVKLGRFPHRKFGMSTKEDDAKIMEALQNVEMVPFANSYLEDLSGGQQQRCLIAMALAQDTKTIVLDEPTNHLDVRAQLEIVDLLHHLNHTLHKTIILVIHDLNYSIRYSDKSLILKDGKMVAFGDTQEVVTEQILKDVFEVNTKIGYDHRNRKFIEYAWLDGSDTSFVSQNESMQLADLMQSAPILTEEAAKRIDQISFLLSEKIISKGDYDHLKEDILKRYRIDANKLK